MCKFVFLLSFSLSFCSTPSSFLPASHHGPALPSVLHTEERNAPSGCSAFTRCQKLKSDKRKNPRQQKKKNTETHRKGRHTRFEPSCISIARDFAFLFHFLNVRYYLFQHTLTACFYLRNRKKLSLKCLSCF